MITPYRRMLLTALAASLLAGCATAPLRREPAAPARISGSVVLEWNEL
ncbi:MAG: hypothetical protein JO040_03875, partial [Gemmatimonadetes bacterium]|nr:hypothetical protein [Gemmatimonadota bacterium]